MGNELQNEKVFHFDGRQKPSQYETEQKQKQSQDKKNEKIHRFGGGQKFPEEQAKHYQGRLLPECTDQKFDDCYTAEKLLHSKAGDRRKRAPPRNPSAKPDKQQEVYELLIRGDLESENKYYESKNKYKYYDHLSDGNAVLLRMRFGTKYYVGSGTVIGDTANGQCVVLTCAHNVVNVSPIDGKVRYADNIWLQARDGNGKIIWCGEVTSGVVYPPYFANPSSASGHDLALVFADITYGASEVKKEHDYIHLSWHWNDVPVLEWYGTDFRVAGYPGEKKGELWWGHGAVKKVAQKDLITYTDIDTTPGQSGGSITKEASTRFHSICCWGVHTGGSVADGMNWGTCFSRDKLKWIASFMRDAKWTKDGDLKIHVSLHVTGPLNYFPGEFELFPPAYQLASARLCSFK